MQSLSVSDCGRLVLRPLLLIGLCLLAACGGGDSRGRFAYKLSLTGFPDSSTITGHYEGWAVVKGIAVSTGKFVVDGTGPDAIVRNPERTRLYGTASSAEFGPSRTELGEDFPFLSEASYLFFTVEAEGDRDQTPSCNVLLAGRISNENAVLLPEGVPVGGTVPCAQSDGNGGFFLGLQDFSQVSGSFQLLSPTDDLSNGNANDDAGVWFVSSGAGPLQEGAAVTPTHGPSLVLPQLGSNARYEAWAVVDGQPRSLGTFRNASGRDDDAMVALQRGPDGPGFDFPGGDFVADYIPPFMIDPPALDLTTAVNFTDGDYRAYVTIEPARDNDRGPFPIELLSAPIPPDAVNSSFQSRINVAMASQFVNLPTVDAGVTTTTITLTNIGLAELVPGGSARGGHYQLWVDIAGQSFSAGRFVVTGSSLISLDSGMNLGNLTVASFSAATTGLLAFPDATQGQSLYITVEDEADDDGLPERVLLAGALVGNQASLDLDGDGMGLGLADFSTMSGLFSTATPTDDDGTTALDDNFGIHFRDRNQFFDFLGVGLNVPILPQGFVYEGWVQDRMTGRNFSTGRFRDPSLSDEDHATSPSEGASRPFNLPGKDFLFDVMPAMLTAAQAGSITEVFITVETIPDGAAGPSFLRVLEATVPGNAAVNGVGGIDVPMQPVFPDLTQFSGFMSFAITN